MKKLFALIFLGLVAATFYTTCSSRERVSDCPVITWRTDTNPQREEQVMLFREWLVKNGHVLKDRDGRTVLYSAEEAAELYREYGVNGVPLKPGDPHHVSSGTPKPGGDVLLETANNQSTLIQAVSGMAGDIFDTDNVLGFQQLGIGVDITADAEQNGFGRADTYPGMAGNLTGMDGGQYAYPCNGASVSIFINLGTLKKHGFDRPPLEWTPEEFEEMGKAYVKKANEGLGRQRNFFFQSFESGWSEHMMMCIMRSRGLDIYNETLTRSVADDERLRHVFALLHKWTFHDKLAPAAADVAAISDGSAAGYGGADFSALASGRYAMLIQARYCLIRLREIQSQTNTVMEFGVSQMPMYEFKNHPLIARAAMLYRGSRQPELAKRFLQFLAGKEYNLYIVEGADGLPPNPSEMKEEIAAISRQYPNETNVHASEFEWAQTIALPPFRSPYVKAGTPKWLLNGLKQFFNNRMTLEEAVTQVENRYNMEIETSKNTNPAMKKQWDEDWAIQQKIDKYKEEGRKIPARWIKNPFHLKYYREKNMLEEEPAAT